MWACSGIEIDAAVARVAKGIIEDGKSSVASGIWDREHGLPSRHGVEGTVITHEHNEATQIDRCCYDKHSERTQKMFAIARHGSAEA